VKRERVLAGALLLSVLPTLAALVAVRPASATAVRSSAYDSVSTTAIVAGVSLSGDVGASGGLLTLDGGSARVAASLDGSPSAHVIAAPYEPGGLVRTVVGQVNPNLPPEQRLSVPDAEASSPGTPAHAAVQVVPGTSAGPLAVVGGSATADAAPHRAAGTATGTSMAVASVLSAGASTSTVELLADAAKGTATQTARTSVSSLEVGGVLTMSDVVATAAVTASDDVHSAKQTLTVGGASVSGQAVTIGNDGVVAAGTSLLPGQSVADATSQANAQLAAAGITVHTLGGIARHDSRSATADSGGVLITVTTPGLPVGGVAGNTFTILVGSAALTELDAHPVLSDFTPPGTGLQGSVGSPGGSTTTFVPGAPGTPALPGTAVAPPTVAPTSPVAYVLAGRRLSARTALVAFAVWQLLSLGIPTLYALVERRRRLALVVVA
jgi:hypothetical protein